ncbi:phosphoglycerate mutase family protein [uncultured Flavobacterium sp.]|uniref:SixA phosphatase family protein n=1 Tax=uncultured Flavobacterium sp. TaxID=165435 RepID=UPI0030CA5298
MIITLIRHAKSTWKEGVKDHDRSLSSRGVKDANLVFADVSSFLTPSSIILSSTSNRTTQTAKIFSELNRVQFDSIRFKKELYTFNTIELEKVIKKNNVENLIIFGHNNAITDFVNKYGDYYIANVPTCGVVIIQFEELDTFSTKKGVIIKTIFPRDLK